MLKILWQSARLVTKFQVFSFYFASLRPGESPAELYGNSKWLWESFRLPLQNFDTRISIILIIFELIFVCSMIHYLLNPCLSIKNSCQGPYKYLCHFYQYMITHCVANTVLHINTAMILIGRWKYYIFRNYTLLAWNLKKKKKKIDRVVYISLAGLVFNCFGFRFLWSMVQCA